MVVMLAVSTALVLTYAFLRTQTTMMQISRNGAWRESAREAAETGAAVALERIHSPEWTGVDEVLTREVRTDTRGTTSYTVSFHPLEATGEETLPEEAALYMVIRSRGEWQSADDPENRVEQAVEVVVRLLPRVEGRTISAGDTPTVDDHVANPGDYGQIQQYALFAEFGDSSLVDSILGSGYVSLVLDPADRIDGDVWLYEHVLLYRDPRWSSSVRREMLDSIGQRYTSQTGARHPHPLMGTITFYNDPPGTTEDDMERLEVPWRDTDVRLTLPSFDDAAWPHYRLYEGGFEYTAVTIGSTLDRVTLGPTPDNPLGVFYRSGSVKLGDDVTLRGTLVATGEVHITGEGVHLGSYNWRDAQGRPLVSDVAKWPRLPAVVASEVRVDRSIQATIEGAVVTELRFRGAGGDFEYVSASDVSLAGTATARPLGQPYSLVQLEGQPDLSALTDDGSYSVWLQDGSTGGWHAIVGVDAAAGELTVVGEIDRASSTAYRIARTRRRYIDVRGPVATRMADINRPPAWAKPSADAWSHLHNEWEEANDGREDEDLPPIAFVDWLADPGNFSGWGYPHDTYGLRLEPTFHLRYTEDIRYQWSPPLFRPYTGGGDEAEFSGYRWKVIAWNQVE